jgi:hypothetical protein
MRPGMPLKVLEMNYFSLAAISCACYSCCHPLTHMLDCQEEGWLQKNQKSVSNQRSGWKIAKVVSSLGWAECEF